MTLSLDDPHAPLPEDFEFAAKFYCAQAFGTSKLETLERLQSLYVEREYLDPLVRLFMRCREQNAAKSSGGSNVPEDG